jgi:leader peptidase (prepilin peptidase) / N-methyltransferase
MRAELQFVFTGFMFLLGLTFGSFLNVCIYRLPQAKSLVKPRSACPHCGARIKAYDNIPLLSWLILRGRCRGCHARISARYPLVELLTALAFACCWLRFGPAPAETNLPLAIATVGKFCTLSFLLIGLIFIDAEWKLLPDAMTLPGLWLGLLFSLVVPAERFASALLPGRWWLSLPPELAWRLQSLVDSLAGAAVGAGFIYGAGFLYLKARGIEGMGFGDVKFMAMVGAFLGVRLTLFTIMGASLLGALFGLTTILVVWVKRTRRRMFRNHEPASQARRKAWQSARLIYSGYQIPFGSFLGSVALVALFYGNDFLGWYGSLYT